VKLQLGRSNAGLDLFTQALEGDAVTLRLTEDRDEIRRQEVSTLQLGQPFQRSVERFVFFCKAETHHALIKAIAVKG
jgi:hypothetical protein